MDDGMLTMVKRPGVGLSHMYKFEKLEVYQLALDYVDLIYALADRLPHIEEFNLKAQMRRAATSVVLNIAEGSTGQTNAEQSRFLGMAVRSLFETRSVSGLDLPKEIYRGRRRDLAATRRKSGNTVTKAAGNAKRNYARERLTMVHGPSTIVYSPSSIVDMFPVSN